MSAIAALLNVTAERGGAATLDRRHGMPLRVPVDPDHGFRLIMITQSIRS